MTTVFIDELKLSNQGEQKPCPEDSEVWVDPLPDEDDLKEWASAFGEVEDVFRIPDSVTSQPSSKGYVKFKGHSSAALCVERGAGKWSESERWLSSQQQARRGDRASVYSENMVSKILGTRGDVIAGLRDEVGAKALMLRGEGLGENDKMESSRVHFVCKASPEAAGRLQAALERAVDRIHAEVKTKTASGEGGGERHDKGEKGRDREHRSRDHNGGEPWRPPGGEVLPPPAHWMYPPPPGGMPPGSPGWYPPPPWGPAHGFPLPWVGPPGPGGPPPLGHFGPGTSSMDPPPGHFGTPGNSHTALEDTPGDADHQVNGERAPSQRRRRRRETGEGNEEGHGGRRRRRRRDEEPPTASEGQNGRGRGEGRESVAVAQAETPQPAAAVAEAPVGSMSTATVGFLDRLPAELTKEEEALGKAVLEFLRNWVDGDTAASPPNMVHLGGDARVREFKSAAVPREVSLKAWLKQRFKDRVEVKGQGVVAID